MARTGSVPPLLLLLLLPLLLLPLLLPSAVEGGVYEKLDNVSDPYSFDHNISYSVATASDCESKCDAKLSCSGYVYNSSSGMCYLYFKDCRGPSFDSSHPQAADNYMARNTCPGNTSDPCACPDGFRRYGHRCLAVLDQPVDEGINEALMACSYNSSYTGFKFGAGLAVPRSEAENEQLKLAARQLQAKPQRVWLGIHQNWSPGRWRALDFCGPLKHYFWASEQANANDFVVLEPLGMASGWYGVPDVSGPYRPICQLSSCFRPDCPQT